MALGKKTAVMIAGVVSEELISEDAGVRSGPGKEEPGEVGSNTLRRYHQQRP